MVMGEDTVGACGEAFAVSDGVCVYVCVCAGSSAVELSVGTHPCLHTHA